MDLDKDLDDHGPNWPLPGWGPLEIDNNTLARCRDNVNSCGSGVQGQSVQTRICHPAPKFESRHELLLATESCTTLVPPSKAYQPPCTFQDDFPSEGFTFQEAYRAGNQADPILPSQATSTSTVRPARLPSFRLYKAAQARWSALLPRPEEPPNGGLVAWLQVLGAGFLFFNTWGFVISFGVFQAYLQQNILANYTPSAISWIGTTQVFLLVIVGVISGPLYDMGYLQALLGAGALLTVSGYVAASFATTYAATFLSLGVAIGLGTGCLFTPSLGVLATWFTARRLPIAAGASGVGSCVGGVVIPLVFRAAVDAAGYAWACRAVAFVALATLSAALLLLKPNGAPTSTTGNRRRRRQLIDPTALTDVPFILFTLAMLCFCTGLFIPFYYLPQFASARLGATDTTSAYLVAAQNGAAFLGRLLPGLAAATRFGPLPTLLCVATAAMALAFAWTALRSAAGVVVMLAAYGNCAGGVMSLTAACVVALSGSSDGSRQARQGLAATRIGMAGAVYAFGLLVGNPIAGAILRSSSDNGDFDGFERLAVFAGVMILAGSTLAGLTLLAHERSKLPPRAKLVEYKNEYRLDIDSLYDKEETNVW